MDTKRKVQVGAAAVIANGLLALSIMSPGTALANPCPLQSKCVCGDLAYCQSIAQPGCTATGGAFCTPSGGWCGSQGSKITICEYK